MLLLIDLNSIFAILTMFRSSAIPEEPVPVCSRCFASIDECVCSTLSSTENTCSDDSDDSDAELYL